MAETPFASAQDVADRWRPLSPSEQITATVLLGDASDMVREQFPDVDTRLADGSLRPTTLTRIVVGMVKRALSNPEGKVRESVDDYSWQIDPQVAAGYLFLSAADKVALQPKRGGRAFAVDLA